MGKSDDKEEKNVARPVNFETHYVDALKIIIEKSGQHVQL